LVRLLQRLQRDMGSSAGSHIRQVCWIFPSYVAIFFIYLFILNL
jgi:hypothetical protein